MIPIYPSKRDKNYVFEFPTTAENRQKYVIFNIRFNSDDAVKEALDDVLIDIDIVRWDAMQ